MKYVAYNDYSRTMDFHNGSTETIWHCGRCMTIKSFKGADCPYCKAKYAKQQESLNKLKERWKESEKEDKGEDLI
jgi:hypothetical protein